MPPLRDLSRRSTHAPRLLAVGLALGLVLASTGCARSRSGRRFGGLDLGANTPPLLKGGLIRSQDGSSLVRRLRRRDTVNADRALASAPPRVRWTDPPVAAPPAAPARLVEMPPPPVLPVEVATAPVSPPPARTVSQTTPVADPEPAAEPPPDPAADDTIQTLRALIDRSRARLGAIRSYQVSMNRQEQVNGELLPAEDVLLSIRREPRAVRLEWPEGKSKGREVLYSAQETGGQMMVNSPGTLVPRVSLAPDSPLVLRSSRHPITEAGFDSILDNLDRSLRPHEAGQPAGASMVYDGQETPPQVGRPCHSIVETRANGERWVVYLDAERNLPAMVRGTDASGALLESYVFGVPSLDPAALDAPDAFNPDARWGKSRGLFGKFASGSATTATGPR